MHFMTFIARNLRNRPVRTVLTVLGLAVGIGSVMLLNGVAAGFERSFLAIYSSKGIDLVVVRAGISNQLSSNLDETLIGKLRGIDGVAEVAPSLMDTVSFEDANLVSVLANGWEGGTLLFRGVRILSGRVYNPGEAKVAILGRVLALNLGKKVGDPVEIAGEPFRVIGIFESQSLFENGGLVVPLGELQRMMGRQGQVTGFVVKARSPEADALQALGRRVEAALPGVAATPARDYVAGDVQIRLARAMASATTAVALVLGSVGLLNTMVMAVAERTGEIGLLRALGWKRRRVLGLVLGEAALLGLLGTIAGGLLAVVGVRALLLAPSVRAFIDPNLAPATWAIGAAMGLGLSVLGGLYPALRAAALDPIEALHHD